jgi:hypothetical protein
MEDSRPFARNLALAASDCKPAGKIPVVPALRGLELIRRGGLQGL